MVRCFIGFLLPEGAKRHVVEIWGEIAKWPIVCKHVEADNLHVCLSFLGEIGEQETGRISETLDEICENYKKFEVAIGKMRAIPSENYIRVLALEVLEKTGVMEKVRAEVVQKIGGDSKPPHLTLCRVKNVSDKKTMIQKICKVEEKGVCFTVAAVQLIKSELSKTGPIYSVVHESNLGD
jgi:2'-5' RNA ligase